MQLPNADFIAENRSPAVREDVHFIAAAAGGVFEFGDGQTSDLNDTFHAYADPGVYTVKFTAPFPGGTVAVTRTDYITVT